METPDPPSDTPGASKQVVLTPHDIPRSLRDIILISWQIFGIVPYTFSPGDLSFA